MEILDINEFRFDSGVIFNDKDPRFETVLENHINKTQERLFKRTKDSPYFLMFDGIVSCLANCCFFVQIKEKMYGLGIENCWIKVFENDGEYIHCGLLASFHLYSTACGFYRVTNITIAEKTFMKCELEKERLFHIRTYSRNSCPFRAIFIEKEGDYERIKWKKVYKQQELKSIILKNYYLKTINPRLYLLEVAKNNKVFFSLESEKVYLLSSSFSFLAYAKVLEGIKKIIFTNYYKNEVLLIVPFKGLYKELQLIDWKLDDWFIENKLKTLFKNPLMLYTLDEIDKLYDLLLEKAQKTICIS